ncbi:MAG: Frizzy aggregation protein FrzB [Myxococcaceae bacterium]
MSAAAEELDFGGFTESEVELIVFEVGSEVYAADAALVVRIDRPDEESVTLGELGPLKRGNRALVFAAPGAKGSLRVDAVRGVVQVDVNSLRRLPMAARTKKGCAMGVWLEGAESRPVLLIDLFATVRTEDGA